MSQIGRYAILTTGVLILGATLLRARADVAEKLQEKDRETLIRAAKYEASVLWQNEVLVPNLVSLMSKLPPAERAEALRNFDVDTQFLIMTRFNMSQESHGL